MARAYGRFTAGILATLLTGALAACTPDPAVEPEEPTFSELAVPSELEPEAAVVSDTGIVPAATGRPWLVSGVRTDPGGVPRAVVWTLGDSGAVAGEPAVLDVPGAVQGLAIAGGPARTAVVGSTWADGRTTSFLLTSTDRASWAPVPLPAEIEPVPLTHVAEAGGTIAAFGVDRDARTVRGMLLPTAGDPAPLSLPEGEGRPAVVGVAGREAMLVVVVSWDDGVGDDAVITYRSADFGASWTTTEVPGAAPQVAGAATTATGFVLTGSVRETGSGGPVTDAAAWYWEPGAAAWDLVDFVSDEGVADRSSGLSSPAVGGEDLAAVYWGDDLSASTVVMTTDGHSATQGMSDDNAGIGFGGPSAWVPQEHAVRAVLAGDGGAYVTEVREGRWRRLATLARPARWFWPAQDDSGGSILLARRQEVSTAGEGWRRWITSATYAADAGALVEAPSDVPDFGSDVTTVRAVADGQEVAIRYGWAEGDRNVVVARSWVRADGGEWVEASGWPGDGLVEIRDVGRVGNEWVAVGVRADSPEGESVRHAAVWRSADGLAWAPDDGFDGGDGRSSAQRLCVLPDGRAWVLGTVVDGDREVDVSWVPGAAGWERFVIDPEGAFDVDGCVDAAEGAEALLQVRVDGLTELRGTSDGVAFAPLAAAGDGETFGEVVPVAGGYAAVGTIMATGTEQPVLWLSADLAQWHHLALPARVPGVAGTVHRDGEDAVVTLTGDGGVQAWRVHDVAELVAAG